MLLLVVLFAPQIAWLVGANEFSNPALTGIAIDLMRMAAPTILFLGIASVLTGALFALKRFTVPAFIGAAFNGTIVIIALLRPDQITSLVWGMLFGSLLQIVLQLVALRDARLRWQFDWHHPAVRRILKLYAPILAGLVVNQLAIALSYNLATRTGDQSISYMKFATTLYQFPLGLVVTALSVATLPTLARQATDKLLAFKQTLSEGLRLVITLILPATAGLFALAVPIVSLLFEHGEFNTQDTEITALVLRVYLIGLPFAAVDQMLIFSSYARKDTWRPALVGVISIIIYSITAVILLRPLGLLSLMVADSVKHVVAYIDDAVGYQRADRWLERLWHLTKSCQVDYCRNCHWLRCLWCSNVNDGRDATNRFCSLFPCCHFGWRCRNTGLYTNGNHSKYF